MYSCDNDEVMMKLFADHGQIESDIRHAYTKTQQNTCKKKKKSIYTVINIALLFIEMLQLN